MYGDLQGMNKDEARKEFGEEQVHQWRRSYDIAPPGGESLKTTGDRTLPYFDSQIAPLLKAGKSIIIAAHGNSLRALVKHLEKLTPEEILAVEIPTGTPIVYELNEDLSVRKKTILE
jgi:2,3-bisphosphoglycerate-dependent phosphoglycerate mutase